MSDVESLEEQNIVNLIEFYEKELRMILEGAPPEGWGEAEMPGGG
jgi:hypothetical protein